MLVQFFKSSLTVIVNIYIIILFITGALSSTDPSVFDQEASLAAQEARSTVSTSGMKKCLVGKIMQNTPPPPHPTPLEGSGSWGKEKYQSKANLQLPKNLETLE